MNCTCEPTGALRVSGVKVRVPEPATWTVWRRAVAVFAKKLASRAARIVMKE